MVLLVVPDLPPPNEHSPNSVCVPATLADLLALEDHSDNKTKTKGSTEQILATVRDDATQCAFLKEIRGFKALNFELSWRFVLTPGLDIFSVVHKADTFSRTKAIQLRN